MIRLTRTGAKKRACYRIVAIHKRKARNGRPLEYLGTYDPKPDPAAIDIKTDRVQAWVAKGAQLSPAVRGLLRRSRKQTAAAS